jgi:hypothetical protein
MQASAATGSRLSRGVDGAFPYAAEPTCGAFNLEWRPRAGNLSGDTRAGKFAR